MNVFFFFNDTATTEIYTLSLHDALPILASLPLIKERILVIILLNRSSDPVQQECRDRKSGSAGMPRPISYAVFCLKKKKQAYDHGRYTATSKLYPPLHTIISTHRRLDST